VLGSINPNNHLISSPITEAQLQKPMKQLFAEIPKLDNGKGPRMFPEREAMTKIRPPTSDLGALSYEAPAQHFIYEQTFMTNKVPGLRDRYILILRYDNKDMNWIKKKLSWLQKEYNLTEIFIFEDKESAYGVCLKTFQRKRINKIMKRSYADNMREQTRFTRLRMPIGPKISNGKKIAEMPRLVDVLDSDNDKSNISQGHYEFIIKMAELDKIKVKANQKRHGNKSQLKVTRSRIKISG